MLLKFKSLPVAIGAAFVVCFAGIYWLYAKATVIEVAGAEYTYNDIEKNFYVESMIAKVIGGQALDRSDVAYNLSVVAIQKQLLANNQIDFQEAQMIELLEQSTPFKGLYKTIEEYLGDDYFRLFIEPIAVSQLAQSLFDNNNPRRGVAELFHQQAMDKGIDVAASENGVTPVEITLDLESSGLAQTILAWANDNKSDNLVYPSVLELDDRYIIAEYDSNDDKSVIIAAIPVLKQKYKEFMIGFAVPYQPTFSWFSWYDIEGFKRKQNSIF